MFTSDMIYKVLVLVALIVIIILCICGVVCLYRYNVKKNVDFQNKNEHQITRTRIGDGNRENAYKVEEPSSSIP